MAYVGNPIDTQNTFQSLVGKRFSGDGSTTAFTLDVAPGNVLDIEVFVGNVRQDPNSAYTLSGTTLTFTGAPPSGTNNIYVVHQAKSVGTIDVPAGGVAAGSLATSVLTGQTDIGGAIADADLFLVDDGAGGTLRKTAASRIKTYVGDTGKVLQVVTATDVTERSTTSTSFSDITGLSVAITPSATSSKVLVMCTTTGYSGNTVAKSEYTLLRGSTNLSSTDVIARIFGANDIQSSITMIVLDSPSTTSATTYKAQFRRSGGSGTAIAQQNNTLGTITVMEIGA